MPGEQYLPAALRSSPSFVLGRVAAVARQAVAETLADAGLSQHQYDILCCLDEYGPAFQKDVAARLSIDTGDIVAFIDGLRRAELISRERDERDRRRQVLTITPAGAATRRELGALLDAGDRDLTGPLTAAERAALVAGGVRLLAHHSPESWPAPPASPPPPVRAAAQTPQRPTVDAARRTAPSPQAAMSAVLDTSWRLASAPLRHAVEIPARLVQLTRGAVRAREH